MRRRIRLLLATSLALAPLTALAAESSVDDLAWLAGCWESVGGEAGSGEQWTRPAGGTLLGVSRTVREGKTVAWEFVRIAEVAPGELAYIANPSGQSEAAFPLLRAGEREVVFENLEHDFPQRILYRLGEDGLLAARIEGMRDGKLVGVDFPLRRIACDVRP